MSLILEALRKSEAERQRGRAPGLFVEQVPSRHRRGQVPAWALGAAAAVLLAVVAAWWWREAGRDDAPATVTRAGAVTAPAAEAVASGQAAIPAATPRPAFRDAGPDSAPVATPPVAAPPPVVVPAPEAATVDRAMTPMPVVEPDPVVTVDTAAPAIVPLPAETAAPTPAPATVTPVDPAAAPADPPLPGLASLSGAERTALPPLKLSMHVYSDDPARRFVIVDGKRLVEGASPAAGVVVEAIRRDGAVLAVNGRRVLLTRP